MRTVSGYQMTSEYLRYIIGATIMNKLERIENTMVVEKPTSEIMIQEQYENIVLLTEFSRETAAHIREIFEGKVPEGHELYVLDFPLIPSEKTQHVLSSEGELLGFRHINSSITNLDHHIDNPAMWRRISSVNLATEYVREYGNVQGDTVVIHHTDPDSVCSSIILVGTQLLGQDVIATHPQLIKELVKAGNSADHTGEENDIADLLGAIEVKRDYHYSIRQLQRLLLGEALDMQASELMSMRRQEREAARQLVADGALEDMGNGVMYAQFDHAIRAEFFPALLPEATAFVLASPISKDLWQIKTRTGLSAPEGLVLNRLDLPSTNGRWNALATKRSGGWSGHDPREYAHLVREKIAHS